MKGINTKYLLVGLVVVVAVVLLVVQNKQSNITNSIEKLFKKKAHSINATPPKIPKTLSKQLPNGPTETDAAKLMEDTLTKANAEPADVGSGGNGKDSDTTQEGFSGFSGFSKGGAGQCFSGFEFNSDTE